MLSLGEGERIPPTFNGKVLPLAGQKDGTGQADVVPTLLAARGYRLARARTEMAEEPGVPPRRGAQGMRRGMNQGEADGVPFLDFFPVLRERDPVATRGFRPLFATAFWEGFC